jgi:hypothetical protein
VRKGSGPDQLPQGAASQLNSAYAGAKPDEVPGRFPDAQATPPARTKQLAAPQAGQEQVPDLDGFLFGSTQRPQEPVTAGLPFGAGLNHVKGSAESAAAFQQRIANTLLNSPQASTYTKAMAARMLNAV